MDSSFQRSRPKTLLDQPLHANIRQILREQILNEFAHDERFSSVRDLITTLKVSQPTVVRALRDLVSEGYLRPDSRRGFFVQKVMPLRYVGLICPVLQSTLLEGAVSPLALACRDRNILLNIYCVRKGEGVDPLIQSIRHRPAEERIIMIGLTTDMTLKLGTKLTSGGYKHLVLGPRVNGLVGSSLALDHSAEVDLVLDHLTSLGHERIVFLVNEPRVLIITNQRAETVKRKIQQRHLPHSTLLYCDTKYGDNSFDAAYQKTEWIWKHHAPRPTAIVPLSGVGAWAVERYAMTHGIRIPEDLSIISFDPIGNSSILPIPLTEITFSYQDRVERALDMLWTESSTPPHGLIETKMVVRASTGTARE
jgi:LacI family transcriptional regulator